MKFIHKWKHVLLEVFILFILSLTPLFWFKPDHIVLGLDSGYAIDYKQYFDQRKSTWLGSQNFGIDMSAEVGIVPYNMLPSLISSVGVSQYNVQKVLFVGWFFVILFSSYLLALYFFPEKKLFLGRILIPVLFLFNLHIYSFWLQGEQPILSSYAILPIFTLILLKFAKKELSVTKTAIYLNLAYFLFESGGVRGFPLLGPVILVGLTIFAYYFLLNYKKEKLFYVLSFVKLSILSILILIPLNAYFLFPFVSSFAIQYSKQVELVGGISGVVDWTRFISRYTSIVNLIRLNGDNNWYDKPYLWAWQYLTSPILIIGSFVFPILAFSASFLAPKKERKTIIFLILLALVGLFFSEGAHGPLGDIYIFLIEKVPGFSAFRSAYYKFIPTVYLSFSILITYTIVYLSSKFPLRYKNLLFLAAIILVLVYHFPYFSNANSVFDKPFSTMIKVPEYVVDFQKFEKSQSDDLRTLVAPSPSLDSNLKNFKWGYFSSYPIFPLISDRGFVQNDAYVFSSNEVDLTRNIYDSLREDDLNRFNDFLKITNIGYILLTRDVAKDYPSSATEDPNLYAKILSNPEFLSIWKKGEWELFKINRPRPSHIEAVSAVNESSEDIKSLGSSLSLSMEPFITSEYRDVIPTSALSGKEKLYACLSCDILSGLQQPPLDPTNVLPDSKLYKLKLNSEKDLTNVTTIDQKTDALLGLSLKRASELNYLNNASPQITADWILAANTLKDYWTKISSNYKSHYSKIIDYPMIEKINMYTISQKDAMNNIVLYRNIENKSLINSLAQSYAMMEKLHNDISKTLNEKDWRENFTYDLDGSGNDISVNLNSLTLGENGPVLPDYYTVDSDTRYLSYSSDGVPTIDKSGSTSNIINLHFSLPNLFANPEEKTIDFDGIKQRCLVSNIQNYSGLKKYAVRVDLDEKNDGIFYIKRNYDTFNTPGFQADKIAFDYKNSIKNYGSNFYSVIQGKVNDKSATVYFCSNSSSPSVVFKNISIVESINPQLYSFEKYSLTRKLPKITYEKLSPTSYTVNVNGATDPFILSFYDRFSPLWEAKIGSEVLSNHFMIDGYANAWYVENKGNFQVTLDFKPQMSLARGVRLSIVTLMILVTYLIISFRRRKK